MPEASLDAVALEPDDSLNIVQRLDLCVHLPQVLHRLGHRCRATLITEQVFRVNWYCRQTDYIADSRLIHVVYEDSNLVITEL